LLIDVQKNGMVKFKIQNYYTAYREAGHKMQCQGKAKYLGYDSQS